MGEVLEVARCSGRSFGVVDDYPDGLRQIIDGLRDEAGLEHETFNSPSEVSEAALHKHSFWLVDKRFGQTNDGLGLFRKLQKLPNKRVIMITGYATTQDHVGEPKYKTLTNNLSVVLSKPEQDTDRSAMVRMISDLFLQGKVPAVVSPELYRNATEYDKFFNDMSMSEQDAMFRKCREEHLNTLTAAWQDGAVWVCIYGLEAVDVQKVYSSIDIPVDAEIDAKSRRLGVPAFVFDRTLSFHNTHCSAVEAHGGANVSSYPRVSMDVDGHSMCFFHFDSGADTSLFSNEFVEKARQVEFVSRNRRPEEKWIQSKPHLTRRVKIPGLFLARRVGDTEVSSLAVEVSGLSVSDWLDSSLIVKCSADCGHQRSGVECKFRKSGLIGRDFYIDNKINLVLSFNGTEVMVAGE